MFHVAYTMRADSLFNGIDGTFTCTDTSVLYPKTYSTKSLRTGTIVATTTYTKDLGTIIFPLGVESVRLKASDVRVYSLLLSEWVYGITFNKVYYVGT